MARQSVHTASAPDPVGPYSQAVRCGGLLFLSGQAPLDPATGRVVEGGVEAQTRQVFANLGAVLTASGSDFEHVLKVNVYLTDLDDFQSVNAIYSEHFAEPYPARTTVGVAALPMGIAVEIEMVAEPAQ